MNNVITITPWQMTLQMIGAFGLGSGIWAIIEKVVQYKLDKKKFLFKEKIEAFDQLTRNIIGFSLHNKLSITVFENFANSARARLMINDKKLDRKISQFFVDLDLLTVATSDSTKVKELDGKWEKLQKESLEILDDLKENLNNTL
ncbi:MAG: hypothetical protein Q8O12_05320 [Candidatus Omnitrophota bacterium]|nr:hypothetical protein [Candidatus Omnitrophota bacterium]